MNSFYANNFYITQVLELLVDSSLENLRVERSIYQQIDKLIVDYQYSLKTFINGSVLTEDNFEFICEMISDVTRDITGLLGITNNTKISAHIACIIYENTYFNGFRLKDYKDHICGKFRLTLMDGEIKEILY